MREGRAERELTQQGFEVFVPLARRTVVRRGRAVEIVHPLFWTYVFVRFSPGDRWQAIYSTVGVAGLVGAPVGDGPPLPVPEREMRRLLEVVAAEGGAVSVDSAPRRVEPGTLVRILFGPFEGQVGRVKADNGPQVDVLIRFIGRERELPFQKHLVEEVAAGASGPGLR